MPKEVDETTYEVALRDGAVFHDGTPVTADDVVFSFERVLNPDNQSLFASFIPFIDSVTKKDDKTVTVKLKFPFSLVPERLSVVKIVPKAAVEKDAKAFDLNPVGTGPWKMTDNGASSQQVVFERNDDYNGPHPAKAKSMTWQIIPDDSTRTNALSSDTVQAIDTVPAANLATLSQTKSVAAEQGFGLLFAMFNCGLAPMDDVRNRQGVMYALDYEKICKVGMSDLATPATSYLQKEHPSYNQAKVQYVGQMEKAKELFAETGLKAVRVLASDHGWFAAVRPMIKESLEAAGLTVTYEEKKSSDVYATIDSDPNAFDIVIAPGDPSVFGDDADLLLRWWYTGDTWTDAPHALEGPGLLQQGAGAARHGSQVDRRRPEEGLVRDLRRRERGRPDVPDLPPQVPDRLRCRDPPGLQADRGDRPFLHRRRVDEVVSRTLHRNGVARPVVPPRFHPNSSPGAQHRAPSLSPRRNCSVQPPPLARPAPRRAADHGAGCHAAGVRRHVVLQR